MARDHPTREVRAQVFETEDGAKLVGRVFPPDGLPRAALLISGATGVAQDYYRAFAEHAAAGHGLVAMTYDYRDMGRSGAGHVRRSRATMADWGVRDQQAARRHLRSLYPDLPIWALGHSLGGMSLPVQSGTEGITRIITVASGNVHHLDHPWPYRALALAFWFGPGPVLAWLLGYLPGRLTGIGPDLPASVYWQWRRWCTSHDTFGGERGDAMPPATADLRGADIKMVAFSDDDLIPPHCVARLAQDYGLDAAAITVIDPADHGLRQIGHIGGFARRSRAVWDRMLA